MKLLILMLAGGALAADIVNWGAQDYWVHTSTWTPEHCQCFCERLCSHPTEYLKKNLVSSGLVPRNKDWTIPRCDEPINVFSPNAIRAAGRANLVQHFPLTMTRDLEHMWDPAAEDPRMDVGSFGYPCGGLHEAAYLKTVVQVNKYIKTPSVISANIGKNVSTQSIRDAFKKEQKLDVVLLCTDGAFADVVTCWTKSKPFVYQINQTDQEIAPLAPVKCPPAIRELDTCTGKTSYIYDFQPTKVPTLVPTDAPTDTPTPTTTPTPTNTPKPTQDPAEVDAWVTKFTKDHGCVIFGEEGCEYCAKAKALYKTKGATYAYRGIDDDKSTPLGMDIYYSLVRSTHQDTLPNIWIGNKFIGGYDDLQALQDKGKLDILLAAAKCTGKPTTAPPKPPAKPTTKPLAPGYDAESDEDGAQD
ncbi:hypothetical protein ACHHYP_03625 [Achlya hypogyna]|uniref:Secreted protein n=1 Tax=Achlya hypogyna TaxID=1202772 RepID=A0A0A7CN85_ACHHY|nr:secreted protein [Achlya hypogyna]OQS00405.1 hypothetical protein ACHHYP_03625 [Achlya hypogyna]